MYRFLAGTLVVISLLVVGCPMARPIASQLPEGATPLQIELAAREDYAILSADVLALMALPSTSLTEAERLDGILDRVEEAIAMVDEARARGEDPQTTTMIYLINGAVRYVCHRHGNEPAAAASCAGR